jgi:hypothetical protein
MSAVTFTGSSASYGAGIYGTDGAIFVGTDLSFTGNTASYGGGLALTYSSSATLTDCDISDNTSTFGGGVLARDSEVTLSGTTIEDNDAHYGGGVNIDGGTFTMSSGTNIDGNAASFGGGILVGGDASFVCVGSTSETTGVWGNTGGSRNGGAYLSESTATITSTTCDWTGTVDNSPTDIYTYLGRSYSKGDNATFTCALGRC